jgi:thiamine pyrophosphate-dependent acetolactate synthase large subunit-like protein
VATNVSDPIVERLIAWGVTRVYGYPGDGINGVMGALRRAQHDSHRCRCRSHLFALAASPVEVGPPLCS